MLVDFASLWGLFGVSFGSIFHFIFVLILWGVKESCGPRQEPPGAAETEPARSLENIFQEQRIVKVSCVSNTPLVPVGTVADSDGAYPLFVDFYTSASFARAKSSLVAPRLSR